MDLSREELDAFLVETDEGLAELDQHFVALERSPGDREILARAFRVVHSIKGNCSFLGLKPVVALAHAGESLLARLRDGKVALDSARTTLLLRMVDEIRGMMTAFREGAESGETVPGALIEALLGAAIQTLPMVAPFPRAEGAAAPAPAPAAPADAQSALERAAAAGLGETSIRVDLARLDQFMNLVGELVLIRNQIAQQVSDGVLPAAETVQRLRGVTGRLQDGVLKVRMQPIGKLWSNLPRVVRDLAAALGKDVELVTEGAETELDRTLIETLRDPLVHTVRNALDHGLESPGVRQAAGKSPRGRLRLRAWHEGGMVHVAIEDDGAGVNLERVRSRAIERGLLDPARAATLGEADLLELIFLPGFSTAETVTSVSGRGVGMDVVRSALERVGGCVRLTTRAGAGTTLILSLPLTLAILSALMVRVAGERYAIPRGSVDEVVRVDRVESFHGRPVLRVRDRLVPLAHLGQVLGVGEPPAGTDFERWAGPDVNAVIVGGDGRDYGLLVDEVLDIEEIVVKPLSRWLRGPRAFAGLTILGDGRVAVILDVAGISRRARVATVGASPLPAPARPAAALAAQGEPVIVVGDGRGGRQAIRLAEVLRIEQLPRSAIESLDGRPVYQYRGRVLPIYDLSPWAERRDPLTVLLMTLEGNTVGNTVALLVDEVLDIALGARHPETTHAGNGVVVVGGQVAALQDLQTLIRRESALLALRPEVAA